MAQGRFKSGRGVIGAIEPVFGNEVVAYLEPRSEEGLWPRFVLDETAGPGHGVAWADLNGDGSAEIIAGFQGVDQPERKRPSVRAYFAVKADEGRWAMQVIDDGGMATTDLKVADMDGDDRLDIISCGGSTRNVKIYLNQGVR